MEIIATVSRIILEVIFIFAGVVKLFNLREFKLIVLQYDILPRRIAVIGAYLHPFFEILAGILLFFDKYLFYGSILIIGMLIIANAFAILAIKNRKKLEDCGCFLGIIKRSLSWKVVIQNCILMLLAIIMIYYSF